VRFGFRACVALALLGAVLFGTASTSAVAAVREPNAAGATVPGPVIILGTSGLRWADLQDTDLPTLTGLLAKGSSGLLVDRSVRPLTCPVDGWLAISAGRRAADTTTGSSEPTCRDPQLQLTTDGAQGIVPRWQSYLNEARHDVYEAQPGLLGKTLADAGKTSAAVGAGAAIALADEQGRVPHAWPAAVDDATGIADPGALTASVRQALATDPDVLVVDLGSILDPAHQQPRHPVLTGAYARPRTAQVQALSSRLGLVLAQVPANATVVVASLGDSGVPTRLQLIAATGPAPLGGSFAQSLLGTRSTRQNGIVQDTDLMSTVLAGLGVSAPDEAVGSSLEPVTTGLSGAARLRKLTDLDQASHAVTPILTPFFLGLVIAQIVLYGAATAVLRRRSKRAEGTAQKAPRRTMRLLRQAAVLFATVPVATFLANFLPWWRSGSPGLAITGSVLLFVVPITAVALLGPWGNSLLGPMGVVGAITAVVLGTDVIAGSHLMLSSLMGINPVVAGRFYGFGNPAFAVFSTGCLLFAVGLADWLVRSDRRKLATLSVAVIGVLATAVDGTPGFGSDFGGPPAIIPAFAVLALFTLGVKVTWRRALLIVAVTVSVIVALSVIDWLRPAADRTHLGRFVQTVIDGQEWPVIRRKAEANLRILFTSYLSVLIPFAVAFVVLVLARPVAWGVRPLQLAYDRSPLLRSGLTAFGVLMLIGFAMNDSGVAIPADAATVAIPLLIAASVRALELQDGEPAPAVTVGASP
jgi:hypothetical protein